MPLRELNPRFHDHIRRAQQTRTIAMSVLCVCLLVGVGLAFEIVAPPNSVARAGLMSNLANTQSQLAAASVPWFDTVAVNLYRAACSLFRDCPELVVQKSEPVKFGPSMQPAPRLATPSTAQPQAATSQTVQQTIVQQPVIERVRETLRTVVEGGVSAAQIDERILALQASLQQQIASVAAAGSSRSDTIFQTIGMATRIDNLAGTNLSSVTVDGVSGLTDDDLPDSLTASNYLPLSGGTLTGDLTVSGNFSAGTLSVAGVSSGGAVSAPYFTATSTTQASDFQKLTATHATTTSLFVNSLLSSPSATIGALTATSSLAVSGNTSLSAATSTSFFSPIAGFSAASFGATATSTFDSAGQLGIGTTNPTVPIDVVTSGNAIPLKMTSSSGFAQMLFNSYRNSAFSHAIIASEAARGTFAVPLPLAANDSILRLTAVGWDGTGFNTESAEINLKAGPNFSGAINNGGQISFSTQEVLGGLATRMVINDVGNVGIGTTTPGSLLSVGNTNGINFSTATSSFSSTGGINLAAGCFALSGNCLSLSTLGGTLGLGSGGTATTTFYNGGVLFSDGTKLTQSAAAANLFWDETNKRLGLGTASPGAVLDVRSGSGALKFSTAFGLQAWTTGTSGYTNLGTLDSTAPLVLYNSSNSIIDVFTSTGNLGIGQSTASYPLSVNGAGRFTGLVDAANFVATSSSATSTFAGGLAVETSGLVYDYSTNRVGIGTNSPLQALSVHSSGSSGLQFAQIVSNPNTSVGAATGIVFNVETAPDLGSKGALVFERTSGWGVGDFHFLQKNSQSSANAALADAVFTIKSTGNVGIGQTSPTYKLDVSGLGRFTGLVDAANFVATSTSATSTFAGGLTGPNSFTVQSSSGNVGIRRAPTAGVLEVGNSADGIALLNVGGTGAFYSSFGYNVTPQSGYVLTVGHGGGGATGLLKLDALSDASDIPLTIEGGASQTGDYLRIQSDGNAGDIFAIKSTGNVGIASSTPWAKLSVTNTGTGPSFVVEDSTSPDTTPFIIDASGNVGIGTTSPWRTLSVTGTVGFDGLTGSTGAGSVCLDANKQLVYNSASDACLSSTRATKHDISPLVVDALAQVVALQPVSFVYNEGNGRTRYGFIAEDVSAIDPHLATYDALSTVSGIDDRSILAILVAAVKDLYAKVLALIESDDAQNARIRQLEEEVAALKSQAAAAGAATGGAGALGGSSAPHGDETANTATTTTSANDVPITSAASSTPISSAANDNDPEEEALGATVVEGGDDDKHTEEQEDEPDEQPQASTNPAIQGTLPQPANDIQQTEDLPDTAAN